MEAASKDPLSDFHGLYPTIPLHMQRQLQSRTNGIYIQQL